jgi:8-oxo-dGTP pyrophosphatase MutT (NUDIX family)
MIDTMPWAVCVLVLNRNGKVLAISRKEDVSMFGLPGGKVDPEDKSIELAAEREFLEETGLIGLGKPIGIFSCFCPGGKDGIGYMTKTFMFKDVITKSSDGEWKSQEGEGKLAWVTPMFLINNSPFSEYNLRLFQTLEMHLQNHIDQTPEFIGE